MTAGANQFLPFATDPGALVQPLADYTTNPNRTAGFSAGIADELQCNRAWRQSGFVAAAVSQFMAEQTGIDVLDDGVVADYVATLILAIKSVSQSISRIKLLADADFYISNTGNNANAGTIGAPWATLQFAWDEICTGYDLGGHVATIHMADGTYAPLAATNAPVGGSILFSGNISTPQNVIVGNTSSDSMNFSAPGTLATLQGMMPQNTGSGIGVNVVNSGIRISIANCAAGNCGFAAFAAQNCGIVELTGSNQIRGGGGNLLYSANLGYMRGTGSTLVTVGTPTFSAATFSANGAGMSVDAMTFTNGSAVSGTRYLAQLNGWIFTNGGGANYVPGSSPGSVATGGQYA